MGASLGVTAVTALRHTATELSAPQLFEVDHYSLLQPLGNCKPHTTMGHLNFSPHAKECN